MTRSTSSSRAVTITIGTSFERADRLAGLDAVGAAGQADVEQHERRLVLADELEAAGGVAGLQDSVARVPQVEVDELGDGRSSSMSTIVGWSPADASRL